MASKYNEKEIKAIEAKELHPESKVICPRCGKELSYRAVGNSYEIKCPTPNCLEATFRGL